MDISIIIPVYNAEDLIVDSLESIKNQTFKGSIEILVIDDCSTDNSVKVIQEYKKNNPDLNIRILQQERNNRQGAARNRGVLEAQGKYVFFLDSDDMLDHDALAQMYRRGERDNPDFVFCDWAYLMPDGEMYYVNNDRFLFEKELIGENCERLLEAVTYFSVNKLYRRDFLINNQIEYGEGYIYEDYEFYMDVCQKAEKISIVSNPYYRVRVNENSTTKSGRKTLIHVESLEKAVHSTLKKFNPRNALSYYHLYKYIIRKTMDYAHHRAPFGHKRKTVQSIVQLLNSKKTEYKVPRRVAPLYYFYFRRRYLQKANIQKLLFVHYLHRTGRLKPLFATAMRVKQTLLKNKFLSNLNLHRLKKKKMRELRSYEDLPVKKNTILFLGFDYRYAGNSRYLFDYIVHNYSDIFDVRFTTKNLEVPSRYRVAPRSLAFYKSLSQARFVIAESWVPLDFKKKDGQQWLQLWHGTPFKKLFFDSNEKYISKRNPNHKKNKQADIAKWDYVLSDSIAGQEKLKTAFAIEEDRIINFGYPRTQWLKENKNNESLKLNIKRRLGIPNDKKVALYVPTWRDYNYKNINNDLRYLLDLGTMSNGLDDYVFINKHHSLESYPVNINGVITPSARDDIQELLLISDLIISDYSSVIFDAMVLNIPFYLFINDFEEYDDARGVYLDMLADFKEFSYETEDELISAIKEMKENYPFDRYNAIKNHYSNTVDTNSNELISKFLLNRTM